MIKIEKTQVVGLEPAIRGMRNAMNSWDRSDSGYGCHLTKGRDSVNWDQHEEGEEYRCSNCDWCSPLCEGDFDPKYSKHVREYIVGPNDRGLMMSLRDAGTDHRKFLRFIDVYMDITAPLYLWKEFETYRIGVAENPSEIEMNSCSTMHKIHAKEFTPEDFSHEHMLDVEGEAIEFDGSPGDYWNSVALLDITIRILNTYRERYLETKDKKYWWQMIQLLPSSYNQRRTLKVSYEALANMYKARKNHKLDEWRMLCEWIEGLPYSELITGKE